MRTPIPPGVIVNHADDVAKILAVVFEAADKHRPLPADLALPLGGLAALLGWRWPMVQDGPLRGADPDGGISHEEAEANGR